MLFYDCLTKAGIVKIIYSNTLNMLVSVRENESLRLADKSICESAAKILCGYLAVIMFRRSVFWILLRIQTLSITSRF